MTVDTFPRCFAVEGCGSLVSDLPCPHLRVSRAPSIFLAMSCVCPSPDSEAPTSLTSPSFGNGCTSARLDLTAAREDQLNEAPQLFRRGAAEPRPKKGTAGYAALSVSAAEREVPGAHSDPKNAIRGENISLVILRHVKTV